MIKDGSFMVRKNPANTKFFQFLAIEDYVTLDMKKQQELKVSGTQKINDSQFSAIVKSIKGIDVKDFEIDVETEIPDNVVEEEDFDEADKAVLPSAPAKKEPRNKMPPEEKVLNFDDPMQKTMPKVKYMHSVLIKDAQQLQQASMKFTNAVEKTNLRAAVKGIKVVIEKLDKHIVEGNLGPEAVKKLLVHSVGLHRNAKDIMGIKDVKSEAGGSAKGKGGSSGSRVK